MEDFEILFPEDVLLVCESRRYLQPQKEYEGSGVDRNRMDDEYSSDEYSLSANTDCSDGLDARDHE